MPAHALGLPVLYSHEDPTPAFLHRKDPGAVGAPPEVGRLGDDLHLVETGVTAPAPLGGEQVVFPHEPQHPSAAYLLPSPLASLSPSPGHYPALLPSPGFPWSRIIPPIPCPRKPDPPHFLDKISAFHLKNKEFTDI